MLERSIERQILCFLNEIGIYAWKNETVGKYNVKAKRFMPIRGPLSGYGSPDILGILPSGRFLGIEVKNETGRIQPHQARFITNINQSGGYAFVSRSVEQTYDQLEKVWPEIQDFRHLLRKYAILTN